MGRTATTEPAKATTSATDRTRDHDVAALSDALATVVRQANLPRSFAKLADVAGVHLDRSAFPILRAVAFGPVRLSALAGDLDVDLSTASRQVRNLEQAGYLLRTPDPDDGRASVLSLTAEGVDVLKRIRATRHALVAESLSDWPDDDVAELARLLERLSSDFLSPSS